jgi:glycosyltransferase involved in cell wall biosynthesis
VVDLDDLFEADAVPRSHPSWELFRADLWPRFARLAAESADLVTVATDFLADFYRPFGLQVRVVPNFWPDFLPGWGPQPEPDGPPVVGFSGTATHLEDIKPVLPALRRALPKHGAALGLSANLLPALAPHLPRGVLVVSLAVRPFPDYLRDVVSRFAVVIAPLRSSRFNRAKSQIRLMEAGVAARPVVASPVGCYRDYLGHGVTGFLADGETAWERAVDALLGDPALRERMGQAAFEQAWHLRASAWAWLYRDVYA